MLLLALLSFDLVCPHFEFNQECLEKGIIGFALSMTTLMG